MAAKESRRSLYYVISENEDKNLSILFIVMVRASRLYQAIKWFSY